eukprot:TRINITY_DN7187_c0_g1_i1.p1 TRINITY_DN7187_c0_g1~~TRINITY_DN7187_c0_g1_i1.p1  ORF type:complete len:175 (-),score=47.98 TRINITY_DN7187_c0_g1_i1:141-665(-)
MKKNINKKINIILPPVEDDILDNANKKVNKKRKTSNKEKEKLDEGNYQSFVCIELELDDKKDQFSQYIKEILNEEKINQENPKFIIIEGDKLHLSLSKTFILKRNQIDEVIDLFKVECGKIENSFKYKLDRATYFLNDEKDKTFLSLVVSDNTKQNFSILLDYRFDKTCRLCTF